MKIWVYRCSKGCQGIDASPDIRSMQKSKWFHKEFTGHDGKITLEDRSVVEEDDGL